MLLSSFGAMGAIGPEEILDSTANITCHDFSGDYIAYINSATYPAKPQEVKLYNYKTDTVSNIFEGYNVSGVAIGGNYVMFGNISNIHEAKLMLYNMTSGTSTVVDTYRAYFSMYYDVGEGHYVYIKIDQNSNSSTIIKTVSGTTVYTKDHGADMPFGYNINNGYVMWSLGDSIHVYGIASDNHFIISVAPDVFMAEYEDTDGTTVIFREEGSYPNEFTRMGTYNIATGAKNSFNVPGSAGNYKIDNGKIYYIDGHLYWMNVDGTGVEQISDTPVQGGYLKVENGKAVVKNPNDQSKLWLFDTALMGGGGVVLRLEDFSTTGVTLGLTGHSQTINVGEGVTFTHNGAEHAVVVDDVTGNSATLGVFSSPQVFDLTVGETKNIDTDGNDQNDLSVTLDSTNTTSQTANLTITTLAEGSGGGDDGGFLGLPSIGFLPLIIAIVSLAFVIRIASRKFKS